jgi:ribosomal protein L25 (general stress protein Ctc)
MKKLTTLLILVMIIATTTFAQSQKESLTKKWKVTGLEEFGTKYDIGDDRKNDWLEFKKDGTFVGVIYNGHVEGRWSASGNKVVINANKSASKTKINWIKVKTVEKDKLVFTYQDIDLIQSTLTFSPF